MEAILNVRCEYCETRNSEDYDRRCSSCGAPIAKTPRGMIGNSGYRFSVVSTTLSLNPNSTSVIPIEMPYPEVEEDEYGD